MNTKKEAKPEEKDVDSVKPGPYTVTSSNITIVTELYMNILGLFTDFQKEVLISNGSQDTKWKNNIPVVCLEITQLDCRILLSELDPTNLSKGFGLIDSSGDLRVEAINLNVIADKARLAKAEIKIRENFSGVYNLAVYASVADKYGSIVTDTTNRGYKTDFEKSNIGKNKDRSQNLQLLKRRFEWL